MVERFLSQTSFVSQEDYRKNLHIRVPENFNFGYDVVDAYAAEQPDKDAYECDSAHRRCRHVSLQEFHGCSSGPTPTVRAFFRPHFTCKHCEQAHVHAGQ